MRDVPIIDITAWPQGDEAERNAIAAEVDRACREWGFLLISGHGIDPAKVADIFATTYAFFDRPVEEKLRIDSTGRPGGRGYFALGTKSHSRTRDNPTAPGDLRETFFSGMETAPGDPYYETPEALRHFAPNAWPEYPPDFGAIWRDYGADCRRLSTTMMHIFARALGLPEEWFDRMVDKEISTMVAQHYPAQDTPPLPGQVRSGAHTDFGTLTLLRTEDRPGGLQIMGLDGDWHDIRPVPDAFIVNLGDMMAQWTNDRWRSTLHRVVNPPADAGAAARRLSVVYFHTPNYDARIECIPTCLAPGETPKYAPIDAGLHLAEKLRQVDSVKAG